MIGLGPAGLAHLPQARHPGAITLRWFSRSRLKSCPQSQVPAQATPFPARHNSEARQRRPAASPARHGCLGTSGKRTRRDRPNERAVVPAEQPRRRPRRCRPRRTSTGGWPVALVAIDTAIKSSRDTGVPVERSTSRLHAHWASSTMWLGPLRARSVAGCRVVPVRQAQVAGSRGAVMASGRAGCGEPVTRTCDAGVAVM